MTNFYVNERVKQAERAYLETLPIKDYTHAVTLTFKQAIKHEYGQYEYLTYEQVQKQLNIYKVRVNRAVYGNSFKRGLKSLAWVTSIEGHGSRFHCHLAIEFPVYENWDFYASVLRETWQCHDMRWSYHEFDCVKYRNSGWLNYITEEKGSIDYRNSHGADVIGASIQR